MEAISLKIDTQMLKTIDVSLQKYNFSTRTEFIRDAIRKRLEELQQEQLVKEFLSYKGKANKVINDHELQTIRKKIFNNLQATLTK
ncbi:MAG: ribbon-helix-helix domain-containing protein [Candidatus Woesearchaeota archaeon]